MMEQDENYSIDNLEDAKRFDVLNKQVIDAIFKLDDDEFAQKIVKQFIDKSIKCIEDLDSTVRRKKTSETYQIAHDLRGSSLYIGTERMTAISSYIYNHAKKRNIRPLKDAVDQLRNSFLESKKELELLIDSKHNVTK
jgi:HPt (histidine-containing phosphotransfer) domain-containing protein